MIKDLPRKWFVYIPTEEVRKMVIDKLIKCSYKKIYYSDYTLPCFIRSCRKGFKGFNLFTDARLETLPSYSEFIEIPLSKILMAEDKEEEIGQTLSLYSKFKILAENNSKSSHYSAEFEKSYLNLIERHFSSMIDQKIDEYHAENHDD